MSGYYCSRAFHFVVDGDAVVMLCQLEITEKLLEVFLSINSKTFFDVYISSQPLAHVVYWLVCLVVNNQNTKNAHYKLFYFIKKSGARRINGPTPTEQTNNNKREISGATLFVQTTAEKEPPVRCLLSAFGRGVFLLPVSPSASLLSISQSSASLFPGLFRAF